MFNRPNPPRLDPARVAFEELTERIERLTARVEELENPKETVLVRGVHK